MGNFWPLLKVTKGTFEGIFQNHRYQPTTHKTYFVYECHSFLSTNLFHEREALTHDKGNVNRVEFGLNNPYQESGYKQMKIFFLHSILNKYVMLAKYKVVRK